MMVIPLHFLLGVIYLLPFEHAVLKFLLHTQGKEDSLRHSAGANTHLELPLGHKFCKS